MFHCMVNMCVCKGLINSLFAHFIFYRNLFKVDLLPKGAKIVGYARSALSNSDLRSRVEPFLKVTHSHTPSLTHSRSLSFSLAG